MALAVDNEPASPEYGDVYLVYERNMSSMLRMVNLIWLSKV